MRKRKKLFILLILLSAALAAGAQHRVRVVVQDYMGQALDGASVLVDGMAQPDINAIFLSAGLHSLLVSVPNYDALTKTFTVNDSLSLRVRLQKKENFETANLASYPWVNSGGMNGEGWTLDTVDVRSPFVNRHSAVVASAASLTPLPDSARLSVTLNVVADGNLTFYSAAGTGAAGRIDTFALTISGATSSRVDLPAGDWQLNTVPVSKGINTFTWSAKVVSGAAVRIDNISFPPVATLTPLYTLKFVGIDTTGGAQSPVDNLSVNLAGTPLSATDTLVPAGRYAYCATSPACEAQVGYVQVGDANITERVPMAAVGSDAARKRYTLSLQVYDEQNGNAPLSGTTVTVGGKRYTTGPDGQVSVPMLTKGLYHVAADKGGYQPAGQTVLLDNNLYLRIFLNRSSAGTISPFYLVTFAVQDEAGQPLTGSITIDGAPTSNYFTKSYSSGSYSYSVSSPGFNATSGTFTVAGASRTLSITLVRKPASVLVLGADTATGLIDCGASLLSIAPTDPDARIIYKGQELRQLTVNVGTADIYHIGYTLKTGDGTELPRSLTLESRFLLPDITGTLWDNVIYVNNNPAANGGYSFTAYEWKCNGQVVSTKQFYSAGDDGQRYDPTATYSLTLTTADGRTLHTCPAAIGAPAASAALLAYPNPVARGAEFTVRPPAQADGAAEIRLYNLGGTLIRSLASDGAPASIAAPEKAGVYIVSVGTQTLKIVVK